MGVLIKGIEMPKDCLHCCFASGCSYCEGYNDHCVFEPDDITTYWDFDNGVFPELIPDWCPLVPVPPHGDLVDKQQMAETNEQHYKIFEGEPEADYARKVVLRMLDQAPTIIPADLAEEGE